MVSMDLAGRVLALLEPRLEREHVELVDVQMIARGKRRVVCVRVDRVEVDEDGRKRPVGVTVADCARISRQIEDILDAEDVVPFSYVLEVSSPGLDRPLRKPEHYDWFTGEQVVVRMADTFGSRRQYTGSLVGRQGDHIVVSVDGGETVRLPLTEVKSARVAIDPWKRKG